MCSTYTNYRKSAALDLRWHELLYSLLWARSCISWSLDDSIALQASINTAIWFRVEQRVHPSSPGIVFISWSGLGAQPTWTAQAPGLVKWVLFIFPLVIFLIWGLDFSPQYAVIYGWRRIPSRGVMMVISRLIQFLLGWFQYILFARVSRLKLEVAENSTIQLAEHILCEFALVRLRSSHHG